MNARTRVSFSFLFSFLLFCGFWPGRTTLLALSLFLSFPPFTSFPFHVLLARLLLFHTICCEASDFQRFHVPFSFFFFPFSFSPQRLSALTWAPMCACSPPSSPACMPTRPSLWAARSMSRCTRRTDSHHCARTRQVARCSWWQTWPRPGLATQCRSKKMLLPCPVSSASPLATSRFPPDS